MSLLNQPTPDAQPAAQATPPVEPSAPAQEQAKEVQPLTIADVERIATEKATRIAQSLVDKAAYRLSNEAQQKIDALRLVSKDLGLTDEQVQQRMQKIVTDDLTTQPQAAQASEPTPEAEPEGSPVLVVLDRISAKRGMTLDQNDPEFQSFLDAWQDPNGSMEDTVMSYIYALDKKTARLQKIDNTAAVRTPGGAGGGAPSTVAASAHEYWETAFKK